jgi:hypothetical protein
MDLVFTLNQFPNVIEQISHTLIFETNCRTIGASIVLLIKENISFINKKDSFEVCDAVGPSRHTIRV